jgi:endogenous inhibitor of DNA gyrase (YacG/DUF329 family)
VSKEESRTIHCPSCKSVVPREHETYPFCSERCRLIDLGNWLGNRYVIPGKPSGH